MAEHGEIAGWMAACVAFLGALGAAMKFWNKPEPKGTEKDEVRMLTARVATLEDAVILLTERQRQTETERQEANIVRGQIFEQIRLTRESVARIEGRLAS